MTKKKTRAKKINRKKRYDSHYEFERAEIIKAIRKLNLLIFESELQVARLRNLNLGEHVARLETMTSSIGIQIAKMSHAVSELAEWQSMKRWAKIKRLFS